MDTSTPPSGEGGASTAALDSNVEETAHVALSAPSSLSKGLTTAIPGLVLSAEQREMLSITQAELNAATMRDEQERNMLNATDSSDPPPGITIDMSRKNIDEIPEEFVDMTKDRVERLALTHNRIRNLPASFSEYKILRYLNIRHNKLETFPIELCNIKTLVILDIAHNNIKQLPPQMKELTSLRVLSILKTRIKTLPLCLAEMEALQLLKFNEMSIDWPPMTILERRLPDLNPPPRPTIKGVDEREYEVTEIIKNFLKEQQEQHVQAVANSDMAEFPPRPIASTERTADSGGVSKTLPTDSGYASGQYAISALHESGAARAITQGDVGFGANRDTMYSVRSSLHVDAENDYIVDLAVQLLRQVQTEQSDAASLRRISVALPDLLRNFALKLGYHAPSQLHRDAMVFIHRNRRKIANAFEGQRRLEEELEEDLCAKSDMSSNEGMSPRDKINFWLERDEEYEIDDLDLAPFADEDDEGIDGTAAISVYKDFLLQTPAYSWLRAALRRETILDFSRSDSSVKIRETIANALQTASVISRRHSPDDRYSIFVVDWNPLAFLQEQSYAESNGEALEGAITLIGDVDDAQALTCRQYICQTWPATGEYVLDLIKELVCADKETGTQEVSTGLPDGSEIKASIHGATSPLIIDVKGLVDVITEIGELLGWLGAALRSASDDPGLSLCFPQITLTSPRVRSSHLSATQFRIGFVLEPLSLPNEYANGQCWRNMFRNPVLVGGYPIRSKSTPHMGLEIPVNIMASLAGADRVNEFNSTTFIKGFSAMLVALKHAENFIFWHYIHNKTGEHVSYMDYEGGSADDLSSSLIESARHVVGWCSDTKYCAGAADAKLGVGRSRLDPPHPGCLLEKVSISAGKIVSGGASFAIGVKDLPIHVARQGYIPKLKWVAQKYVVLWDENEKRGWLVNGTSTLLHTVLASLEHDRKDDFRASCLFDPRKMKDAPSKYKPDSAIAVLTDPTNMGLKIYAEPDETYGEETRREDLSQENVLKRKTTYYRFKNRVDDHYNSLEQMVEHQARVAGQNGINMKVRFRKHLEGWDFVEMVTDHDLLPRVATLHAYGYGWVDFVRAIQAPVLFGRGFGDIIQPSDIANLCGEWRSVPKGRYCLTTSVWDLRRIIDVFGDIEAKPLKVCHDLVWCSSSKLFDACRCRRQSVKGLIRRTAGKHDDPIQVLFPAKSRHILPLIGDLDPKDLQGGAVIWGHSVNFKVKWGETGEPDEGEPPPLSEDPAIDHAEDSGLGSSLSSSLAGEVLTSPSRSLPVIIDEEVVSRPLLLQPLETKREGRQTQPGNANPPSQGTEPSTSYSTIASEEHHRNLRREKRRLHIRP